jgi:hypothetical protein
MNPNEWRITNKTIEVEMLRLADLISRGSSRNVTLHGSLRTRHVAAANASLERSVQAVRLTRGKT